MQFQNPTHQRIHDKWKREQGEFRACDLCAYGTGWEGMRYCNHSEAIPKNSPIQTHREKGGHCGPNAKNLYIPSRAPTTIDFKSRAAGERDET